MALNIVSGCLLISLQHDNRLPRIQSPLVIPKREEGQAAMFPPPLVDFRHRKAVECGLLKTVKQVFVLKGLHSEVLPSKGMFCLKPPPEKCLLLIQFVKMIS